MTPLDEAWVAHQHALTCLAYEILGEWSTAEDVAARAWERADREHREGRDPDNPVAWLRVVTARLAIDEARSARARREVYVGTWLPEPVPTDELPEDAVVTKSLLSLGLLRVLQELKPLERAVFVLREGFAVPYAEIAECVGSTPSACRQMVSRAKRRLPEVDTPSGHEDRHLLTALVSAVADGDLTRAVELVSEGCVLWSDGGGALRAAPRPIVGAEKVARFFLGVQGKNPVLDARIVSLNHSDGLLLEAADGIRLLVLERDADGAVRGLQMHANPYKIGRALPRE